VGVRSIVISVSVCLSVCWHILKTTFHEMFCTYYVWPWLDPLIAMQSVICFRFCEWRHVFHKTWPAYFFKLLRRYTTCLSSVQRLYAELFWNWTRKVSNELVPSFFLGLIGCFGLSVRTRLSVSEEDELSQSSGGFVFFASLPRKLVFFGRGSLASVSGVWIQSDESSRMEEFVQWSFFYIMEPVGRNQRWRVCFVKFVRWRHREQRLPSPTASSCKYNLSLIADN